MSNIVLAPENLEQFYKNENIVWDFERNPHLFPLYLFQYFYKKYSKENQIEKESSTYYSRESVYSKYQHPLLPEKYCSWLIVTTRFKHVNFIHQVGTGNYEPFQDGVTPDKLVGYIELQVFSERFTVATDISTCLDFSVLRASSAIAEEILVQIQKNGLTSVFLKTAIY